MPLEEMLDRLDDLYTFGEGWNSGNYDPDRVDRQREALSAAMDALRVVHCLPDVLETLDRLKWESLRVCNQEPMDSVKHMKASGRADGLYIAGEILSKAMKNPEDIKA